MELKSANAQFSSAMEQMNQQLDHYNSRKASLEDELAVSAVKREAVVLYEQLAEAEAKRDKLIEEDKLRGTPAQEREKLLAQVCKLISYNKSKSINSKVKDDNAEISIMERQIVEAQERMRQLGEETDQLDQDLEENQSERNQKYRELRKREETMDQFLTSYEDTRAEELERLQDLEAQIARLLGFAF